MIVRYTYIYIYITNRYYTIIFTILNIVGIDKLFIVDLMTSSKIVGH